MSAHDTIGGVPMWQISELRSAVVAAAEDWLAWRTGQCDWPTTDQAELELAKAVEALAALDDD